jgi:transposase
MLRVSVSRKAPCIDGDGSRVPTLEPDDLVIMDNLSSHKGQAVRSAIRQTGAMFFLLPNYSPDLNPIEQVFAKLKHLLRKAAARTSEAVCSTIGALLDTYTPEECANYQKHSGCSRTKAHHI